MTLNEDTYYGLFNDSYPPIIDGVTLTVENYAKGFISKGLNPCVITPWNPEAVSSPCKVLKYFSLPIWNRKPYRYGYPKLDPIIWQRLRKTPFKILHSHSPFSSGRLAVYVKKHQHVPLIGTFHSKYKSDLQHSFASAPWMVPIIMKRILDFFNSCDEVWIPQAKVEETVREYGYKGPLVVMPNGNDMAAGYDIDRDGVRKTLGIKSDELALLFVGQHIWEKGIGVILEALTLLNGKVPYKMNFIGDGYALAKLQKKVRQSGLDHIVKVHGMIRSRSELARYYAASDLFLFPSFYDNAPLVMREAAAFATPAIVPEGSTTAEVISNGQNGFTTLRTGKNYAGLIEHLYHNRALLEKAGNGAKNTLVHSWTDVIEEVLDRYKSLINLNKHH